jgi:hypothetical protein
VKRLIVTSIYWAGLLGCQLQPLLSQPALLAEPNAVSAKQIKLIIERALNSKNILISQSAFTQSSQLMVQLKEVQRVAKFDSPTFLSEIDKPDRFILLKDNRGCLIRHHQSQRQWYLKEIDCVSADKAEDTT